MRPAPTARDVPLGIEVADSSIGDDRGEALDSYAAGSIPLYWIVNIPGRQIEVYSGPTGPGSPARYAERVVYRVGDEVPVVLDGSDVGRVAVR